MAKRKMTDDEILAQIPLSRKRAQRELRNEPHASAVRFSAAQRCLQLTLTNGAILSVPVGLIASLAKATNKDLTDVSVSPAGIAIRLDRLDEDLSVAGLAKVALGSRVLMQASGSAGGSARTRSKALAARRNGLKGGRPRKAATQAV